MLTTRPSNLVLIVDDDAAVLNSLKFALELEGFTVRVFNSSGEFLDDPLSSAAACLVIDYKLPVLDGLALIAELRRREVSSPAILITSNPSTALVRQVRESGLTLIEKPLLGNELALAIRDAFRDNPAPPAG